MTKSIIFVALASFLTSCETNSATQTGHYENITQKNKPQYALVIHAGAGKILKEYITSENDAAYRAKLDQALRVGQSVLKGGGSALDAVEATINILEDSPFFNAGKGSVFTHEGYNEMDASIMDGRNIDAGAVAGVRRIKNPISLAREVMENSKHVMLAGDGAEEFAQTRNISLVNAAYFKTERRQRQLDRAKARDMGVILDRNSGKFANYGDPIDPDNKFGTVGAVALDKNGNLAAGTSTGGMTNKRWKRIGDTPVIGAGTYADNKSCGVSATGHGEYFIRAAVAHSICAMMEYKQVSLAEAANEIINVKLVKMGGTGGIIALDKDGNVSMTFNTEGMYRGYIVENSKPTVYIYK